MRSTVGDFDSSGAHDSGDIDLLSQAVQLQSHGSELDLDNNVVVDPDDRLQTWTSWILFVISHATHAFSFMLG